MDALEDSWWPSSLTKTSPFTLPPSSQWLQRQDGNILTIRAGGDPKEYQTNPNWLPFLMLLDIVQITYLQLSNSSNGNQEIFYKGVIFLDSLRRDFLAATQKVAPSFPESMRRWLCRLLHNIPHDPQNRKRHAEKLKKAYLVDVFKYGLPSKLASTRLIFIIEFQIFWTGH
jgi:hypothetical protein